MDDFTKNILWSQFGASIDALDKVMDLCPEEVWSKPDIKGEQWQAFWYLSSHTLFWLDYHLSADKPQNFAPHAPFGLEELDPAGVLPPRVYSKTELKTYLQYCRHKCKVTVFSLTDQRAKEICKLSWVEMAFAELLLYNMRHVQHHTAQLNMMLRNQIDKATGWTFRAKPD